MDEVRLPIFIANNEDDDLTIAPSVISALGNMGATRSKRWALLRF